MSDTVFSTSTGLSLNRPQADDLAREGRVWKRGALDVAQIAAFAAAFDDGAGRRLHPDDLPQEALTALTMLADNVLPGAAPVRVVSFDKSEDANWSLGWHQDRVVALDTQADVEGFGNWTRKQGIWHAEPPLALLERMIFARIHIDPTDESNGCLQIALGSHQRGKVIATDAQRIAENHPVEHCTAAPGDVLFVKALTLHRSGPSQSTARRRTLRIDYCADALPAPLAWARGT